MTLRRRHALAWPGMAAAGAVGSPLPGGLPAPAFALTLADGRRTTSHHVAPRRTIRALEDVQPSIAAAIVKADLAALRKQSGLPCRGSR